MTQPVFDSFYMDVENIKTLTGNQVITVSPKMAEAWLKLNKENRPPAKSHIKELAGRMERGEWMLNGQPLIFDKNGTLQDGQHRLMAVVEADMTVEFNVQFGVDTTVFHTLDDGRKRTLGDVLGAIGVPNYNVMAAACKTIVALGKLWEDPAYVSRNFKSNSSYLEVFAELENFEENARVGVNLHQKSDRLITQSEFVAFFYLMGEIDPIAAEDFLYKFATGEGLEKRDPILVLRKTLIANKSSNTRKMGKTYVRALIIKTWNNWRKNKKASIVKFDAAREKYPTLK